MADYTAKKIDDMEAICGGGFKRARAELGVESFGMQVIDMPPGYDDYPEHDHAETGQEEVYLVLRGSAEVERRRRARADRPRHDHPRRARREAQDRPGRPGRAVARARRHARARSTRPPRSRSWARPTRLAS